MLLRLQKYDLEVHYTPVKYLLRADALSRSNKQACSDDTRIDDVHLYVDMVINTRPISDQRLAEIKRETNNDPELRSVMEVILKGCPLNRTSCRPEAVSFWNVRDQSFHSRWTDSDGNQSGYSKNHVKDCSEEDP